MAEPVLRSYDPTWRDRLAAGLLGDSRPSPERRRLTEGLLGSSGLGSTGGGLIDFTPAGMPLAAQEAKRDAQDGNYMGAAVNAMALAPMAKFRAFHGSPMTDLKAISASPPARQYDNATSVFGAFFSPEQAEAARYAGKSGKVYEANVALQKPYEMPVSEFLYLQAPNKAKDGSALPGEMWGKRAEELKQEALELRKRLEEAGHDGVIIKSNRGEVKEISSFKDVGLD